MHHFERITIRDPEAGGLAYLRHTQIAAAEVVRLVMGGQTNTDILAQFPELEPEDIQEALAYAVHDLSQKMMVWSHEGPVYAHSIRGSSELLAADHAANQRAAAKEIHALARQTETIWNYVGTLAELSYTPDNFLWKALPLAEVIAAAQEKLPSYGVPVTLTVDAPASLPAIRTFGYLPTALCSLAVDYWDGLLTEDARLTVTVINGDHVRLAVHRRYGPFTVDPSQQMTLITWSGGPVAAAALIIQRHGGQLQITPVEDGLILHFELPAAPSK